MCAWKYGSENAMRAPRTALRLVASSEKKLTPGLPSTVKYVRTFSSGNDENPGIGGTKRGRTLDIQNGITPTHARSSNVSRNGRKTGGRAALTSPGSSGQ
jgi:hypothetical protein